MLSVWPSNLFIRAPCGRVPALARTDWSDRASCAGASKRDPRPSRCADRCALRWAPCAQGGAGRRESSSKESIRGPRDV